MAWEGLSTELFEALKIKAKALEKHHLWWSVFLEFFTGDIQNSTLWNGKNPNSGYVAYKFWKKKQQLQGHQTSFYQNKKVPRPGVVNQNQKKSHLDTQGTHGKEHHRQRRAIPEGAIGPCVVVKVIHKERKSLNLASIHWFAGVDIHA